MHGHKKCGWEKSKHIGKIYKQKKDVDIDG